MSGKAYTGSIFAAFLMLQPAVAPAAPAEPAVEVPKGIVDCLLPGALRRVGGNMYQLPHRPARITASECTIRGGDFLLYDRANYETSLRHWITRAEQGSGDAEAMRYVAEIYEQGIGREPDFAAAASWYRKAADAGNATAMIGLAHLYKTGQGVPLDLETAQALYSQAFGSDLMIPLDPTSVAGADQRVETLVAEVDEIRRQKIAVELELGAANDQLTSARRALDDALSGQGTNAGLIQDLQSSIRDREESIAAYQSDLEAIRSENAELTSLKQQLEYQNIEMARLQALLDTAESEFERNRVQMRTQRSALEAEEAKFNALIADIGADRQDIQTSKQEVDELRSKVAAMEAALRKAEDDKNFYQALASDATTHEERVATLTAQITLLEQKSDSIENDSLALRNESTERQNELDAQIAAAADAEKLSAEEMATRDQEIERLRAAVSRAEQEKLRHGSDIDRLDKQSAELEFLRADLEREQAQSNRLQQLLTETQERFSASNQQLEQVSAAQSALEDEIETLRASASSGNQTSLALLERREDELDSSHIEIAGLQARIAASEDEFRQYRAQMADTAARQTNAIENLRLAVTSSRAERIELEEQLSSANQQLANAKSDLDLEKQRFTELQDQLRLARADKGDAAGALIEKQRKLDEQTQQLAMLQQEIERLNEQSTRYVTQINELKVRAQADKIDFAGPNIVLMEPSEGLLVSNSQATRGDTLTRGISVVAATRVNETKVIRGHVEAPAGLAKLTINGIQVPYDDHNSFTQSFELDAESKPIRIVAFDHNGKQDVEEFEYRTDGTMLQAATVHNKAARFKESRNTALDHLKYYALIIANKDYENEFARDLETPFADAEEVGSVLRDRYDFEVDIIYNATKAKIEQELERIFYKEAHDDDEDNDKDAVLIYYAGHGYASDSRTKEAYYWLPVDAEFDSPRTWFKTKELEAYMQVSSVNQIMVVADSCFAGNVLSRDGIAGNFASLKSKDWRRYLAEYTEKKKSRYVFTSGAFAPVLDGGGGEHSVFARAFLDVLETNNEILSAPKMHEQVAPVVMKLAARLDHMQTPLFGYLTSAGHEFGNFYLPAPHAAAETTLAEEAHSIDPKHVFAQVTPRVQ